MTTIADGLERMSSTRWNVIVVSAGVADETDGLRFVRVFKGSDLGARASEGVLALRLRYATTPFIVQPLAGDSEYAIFRSKTDWFLGDASAASFADVILSCATPFA